MRLVGLTGGIGSGKSSVAVLLEKRGAVVVDADKIAREVVEPGGAAYDAVVARFGSDVLREDATLDREALAAIVFADDEARRDLNAMTHPAVGKVMLERIEAHRGTDHVVVLDIPLLAEGGGKSRWPVQAVIVVDVPPDLQLQRLVEQRGMSEDDVLRRMSAQAGREERLAIADFVIDNAGDLDDLEAEVDECWEWLQQLPDE